MIWIALIAAVIVIGGSWLVAKTWPQRIVVFAAAAAAAAGYLLVGQPGRPDEPLSGRIDEIQKQAQLHPDQITPDQVMAIAERKSRDNPNDPEPHYIMGILLNATGRPNEAALAFESALRRNPAHKAAMRALADTLFEISGQVDGDTLKLYNQAYALSPDDARIGYMIGVGEWQAGQKDAARARWAALEAKAPAGDKTVQGLADDLFKMSGRVDPWTAEFYRAGFAANPDDLRVGYFYGVGLWQAGDHAGAEKLWSQIEAKTPEGDPRRKMFEAVKQMATQGPQAAQPAPATPAMPGKPPG